MIVTRPPQVDLAAILSAIGEAEAAARRHDAARENREFHAAEAQWADERAASCRRAARAIIEAAFPGVSWPMIEAASL